MRVFSSTGGYLGQVTSYDSMGRAIQQTNPTEITGAWVPAGDDAAWIYSAQAYDWKGRPTLTTLPDGATRENSYGGCGCAGGAVTTVRDESGRRRKFTMDVLGRLKQVDELNWNQSVYATTTYSYNVRNQLTQINQAGQLRSFAYDGHGRLQTRTTPEQGVTSYSYFGNDAVQTITDARGATTTFGYNSRDLVTSINFGVPAGVAATPNVSFGYDAAGNRTTMTDGLGSVSYAYDQLSRMTSETRTFTNLPGSFALSYAYNLAGELTSITNQWGAQVSYTYDQAGRPISVSGANYAGVSSYVNSLSYRAFGLKQMSYGNGRTLSLQYDSRLRPVQWNIPGVMGWHYAYHYFGEHTARVTYAQNLNDATLDRSFHYDHVGRLQSSFSGASARAHVGIAGNWLGDGPYAMHDNVYDVWGNLLQRTGWGGANPQYGAAFSNNRMMGWVYDQAGNLTDAGGGWTFTYDATGQQATSAVGSVQNSYDGDRLRGKKTEYGVTTYYLRSSVLGGQIVAELDGNGAWMRGYVYLGGELVAVQQAGVNWVHQDPFVKSKRLTNSFGTVVSVVELDPWGGETNRGSNEAFQPQQFTSYLRDAIASDDAMHRRYNRWWGRFEQPDPYNGSYDLTNPQSFNRYSYVHNDPVSFIDPTGLDGDLGGRIGITLNPPSGSVTINGSFNTFLGSGGGGILRGDGVFIPEQEPGDPTGEFDLPAITKVVDALINEDECVEFATTILGMLSKGKGPTLVDVFNAFFNQKHDLFTRTAPAGSRGEATAMGNLKNSTATMFLAKKDPSIQAAVDAGNVVQELFHFAAQGFGGYSDEQLAKALHKTEYAKKAAEVFPDGTANIFDKRYFPAGWSPADGYSTYFHAIAMQYCGDPVQGATFHNGP